MLNSEKPAVKIFINKRLRPSVANQHTSTVLSHKVKTIEIHNKTKTNIRHMLKRIKRNSFLVK